MVKMKNEFTLWNFTLFLCLIYTIIVNVVVDCQRSSKKSDVYIAGFFPYKIGADRSETGTNSTMTPLYILSLYVNHV